ncbi:response regulator [Salinispora pacifica]|uniref:response regulator n=1 Tax=Salinispora pacifica TaxID=351187 RepID=UPI00037CF2C9|nr:response regulator transcription factor [Salinispora pacifica]
MIRVMLADDQTLVRAGLRSLLQSEPDIELVGEAADGEQTLRVAAQARPDVLLMDIRMPRMDGIEATRRIAAQPALSGIRIVILTTFEHDQYIFRSLRAGASGFLVKDIEPAALLQAVRVVATGEALLAPSVTRRLIAEYAARSHEPPVSPDLDQLTAREREVLVLVARGLTNRELAERMSCSVATAKTHVSRVMTKLGARDRVQLVVLAYEWGLVRPGWRDAGPVTR